MESKKKIILAGGRGFLGSLLLDYFLQHDFELVVLTRERSASNSARPSRQVYWDGTSKGAWCSELEDAYALINLAGKSVDCRYHVRNRQLLTSSRLDSTRVLGEAIRSCTSPPRVWLNASTATIYEHTYGPAHSEHGRIAASVEAKDEFSIKLAQEWEAEFNAAECPDTRKVLLRIAMVFDPSGSVLPVLRRLVRLGLGGKMGHGKQFVSWIHSQDFCRAVHWLCDNNSAEGIYNVASPNPLPNHEMMRIIRQTEGTALGLPAARWMLEIGAFLLRTETELIIKSRRVVPTRLLDEGFTFHTPHLSKAVAGA